MHTKNQFVLILSVIFLTCLSACASSANQLPGGLTLEEHELLQPPNTDTFGFQPVESTQAEILSRHAEEHSKINPFDYTLENNNPALQTTWNNGELIAVVVNDVEKPPQQIVRVSHNGENIFTTQAGTPSPIVPLQGLWAYDKHWALEIALSTPDVWAGEIVIDGELVNQQKGYDEAFGFQLLSDKPFFFYERNGQIGFSYDGQEANLPYDNIPHYQCCAESVTNPIAAENMVAFFAQKNETWYYVELGVFK